MSGYTKLSHSIVGSTVWRESAPTRLVWITMLALADQHGEVMVSVPGLADFARVTLPECEEALRVLSAPDPYSRTKDHEGRRIAEIDGGFEILNHKKYRHLASDDDRRAKDAERQRRHREKARDVTEKRDRRDKSRKSRQAEADTKAKAEAEEKKKSIPPDGGVRTTWLTPYALVWDAKFGAASFPFGQAARYLKPIEDALGPEETLRRLTRFVADAEAKFVSLARFAQTHGQYAEGVVSAADADLVALAEEARPEAYTNAAAVRAFLAAQGVSLEPKPLLTFGTRSGLETPFPAAGGASS